MTRRNFLRTTGGMAAALLAMNAVFGRFFDVLDIEAVEAAAFTERQGRAVSSSSMCKRITSGRTTIRQGPKPAAKEP